LLAQWAATAYVGFVSLGLSFLLARQLGPAAFGDYGVALAAGALLGIALDGGFKTLLLRERTLATGVLAKLVPRLHAVAIGHALTLGVIVGVLALVLVPERRVLVIATAACFLGVALSQFISGALRGEGRFVADAGWQAGTRTVSAVAILIALAVGVNSPSGVLLAWAAGSLAAVLFWPHGQARRPRLEWHPEAYRAAAFLLWVDLATLVYFRADMLLLDAMGTPATEIGHYAAGYRIIEALILLATPASLLVFRALRLEWQATLRLRARLVWALAIAVIAGVLAAGVLMALSEELIGVAFGSSYRESARLLDVLAWALFFILPNAVLTQAAIALNRERAYAVMATTAAIFNVGLNTWLIPRHGALGASWATVATEAWLFALLAFGMVRWCTERDKGVPDKRFST
jgi:O-antigen/teichoic acid export membrane protein